MRESDLLSHIYERSKDLRTRFPHVIVGPGDDAAVLDPPASRQILVTVDHLIEGRHFASPAGSATSLDAIARKAIARSVSDIAAMGGSLDEWGAALVTAALPHGFPQSDADALFDRTQHWASHWRCPLVGGDAASFGEGSSAGPLTLTVTVLGIAHAARGPVLRSGAKPGDVVYVTGALGGSLDSGRHLSFEPRVREARELCDVLGADLHAMLDVSDGLGRDAARIAASSGCSIALESVLLPCHSGCDWRSAIGDGEDYELLFTVAPTAKVPTSVAGTRLTRIGTVTGNESRRGRCIVAAPDGAEFDASESGWDHA